MPDFRVHESAPEHRKMRAAGLAAIGLWTMSGAYSTREGTDGWVPAHFVATWPGGKRQVKTLLQIGLWWPEDRDGIPGFRFHDFLDYQRSAEQIEQEKEKARARMAALRGNPPANGSRPPKPPSAVDVRPNKPRTSTAHSPEGSENVHDSLSLSLSLSGGSVGGEVPLDDARPKTPPPPKCPAHNGTDTDPGPCRACGNARQAAETWAADQALAAKTAAAAEVHQRAETKRLAIAACTMCDATGYVGLALCHHDPTAAERAARGREAVAPVLADKPPAPPRRRRPVVGDGEPDPDVEAARARYLEQLAAVDTVAAEADPEEAFR
jgi:hypothetical protein